MGVNFLASAAQNAGNRPVFKALQQSLVGKLAPSRSDAIKQFIGSVKSFDRSDAALFKSFLAYELFNQRKNTLLIESRPWIIRIG